MANIMRYHAPVQPWGSGRGTTCVNTCWIRAVRRVYVFLICSVWYDRRVHRLSVWDSACVTSSRVRACVGQAFAV